MNRKYFAVVLAGLLCGAALGAQTFNSGSNGSDGALDLTGRSGTLVFDPSTFNPPLDPDHDNVYNFTTITIPYNLTVRLSEEGLGTKPIVWLASGAVYVAGTLDLSGKRGHSYSDPTVPSSAGAGGYPGGTGETFTQSWTPGQGPGGARGAGGMAGHVVAGMGTSSDLDGVAYGNDFLIPLVGGSGGAGGVKYSGTYGSGGGAGGGAILIASSVSIDIFGTIDVSGGVGGIPVTSSSPGGGGGSGGSIRLVAPSINNQGTLSARGGYGYFSGGSASRGRIRVEAFQRQLAGNIDVSPIVATPSPVFPPASAPAVRIVSIGGVAVPPNPTASFIAPDVTLDNAATVTIQLAGSKVPVGTIVHLTLTPDTGAIVNVDSTPLAGTFDASTATASITIPHGFSRFSVQASWTP
jgi:hypothetical protein